MAVFAANRPPLVEQTPSGAGQSPSAGSSNLPDWDMGRSTRASSLTLIPSILVAAVLVVVAVSTPAAIDRLAPPVFGAASIGAVLTALIVVLRADRECSR